MTGSADGTAKLWDTVSGREALTLNPRAGAISAVTFTSDGMRIVTGAERGIRIWDAAPDDEIQRRELETAATRAGALGRPDEPPHSKRSC